MVEEIVRARREREEEFRQRHGYMPAAVPDVWTGARVTLEVMTAITGSQLGVVSKSGMLAGINDEGYVIREDSGKVVFLPKHAVVHIELYGEGNPGDSMTFVG